MIIVHLGDKGIQLILFTCADPAVCRNAQRAVFGRFICFNNSDGLFFCTHFIAPFLRFEKILSQIPKKSHYAFGLKRILDSRQTIQSGYNIFLKKRRRYRHCCPPLTIRQYSSEGRRAAKQRRFLTKSLTHSEKIFSLMKSRNAGILTYFK